MLSVIWLSLATYLAIFIYQYVFYIATCLSLVMFFSSNIFIFFEKHLRIIVFIFHINWSNQYHWYINTLRAFFFYDFFFIRFFLAFRYFLLFTGSLLNSFLIILLTFSQISLYFSKNLSLKKTYIQFHQSLFYMHSFPERICIKV